MIKLNVLFLGMGGKLSVNPLKTIAGNHNIVGIVESMSSSYKKSKLKKVIFRINRSIRIRKDSLKAISRDLNIPYILTENVNYKKIIKKIKEINPDVICVSGFSHLLKEDIINLPRYGVINLHPSYLPHYRGANPWFWMFHNMEKEGGVTIHFIDKGEDTGDIIYQEKYPIEVGISSEEIIDRAVTIGQRLMLKALNDIANNNVKITKQSEFEKIKKARNIISNEELINWKDWDVKRTYHFLNGTKAWYGGGRILENELHIWQEWQFEGYEQSNIPNSMAVGTIVQECGLYWLHCNNGRIKMRKRTNIRKLFKLFL